MKSLIDSNIVRAAYDFIVPAGWLFAGTADFPENKRTAT